MQKVASLVKRSRKDREGYLPSFPLIVLIAFSAREIHSDYLNFRHIAVHRRSEQVRKAELEKDVKRWMRTLALIRRKDGDVVDTSQVRF